MDVEHIGDIQNCERKRTENLDFSVPRKTKQ